jgi:(4-(4-[2-(gamma-L-glutamylamino)ethyl]phenoxymethyl)furan-2-yl)methanamine synthase
LNPLACVSRSLRSMRNFTAIAKRKHYCPRRAMVGTLGLDIGGANLKAAHNDGAAALAPFALWKDPADLPARLEQLIGTMPAWDALAVTMTGELCDCFASKRDGARAILEAVNQVARGRPVRVWTNQ